LTALTHRFEQQSSSTVLPSSHCSFVWFTTPSPQRTGVELVVVELLELVLVELVLLELVLLELVVLELVLVELVVLELVDVVLLELVEVVVVTLVLVLLVVDELVEVVVVVGSAAWSPAATMVRATNRPKAWTPRPMRSAEKGAQMRSVACAERATRTMLPLAKRSMR
jgi:hypothetical protein